MFSLAVGGSQPSPKTQIAIISGIGKATNFNFGQYIHRVHPNKSPLNILEKRGRGRIQGLPKIFRAPIYRAHRAVVFAIAQLSCTFSQQDSLCTGFGLLLVSLRRRLPLYDNDGTNSFWRTRLAQWNFLAQYGSQLGYLRSVSHRECDSRCCQIFKQCRLVYLARQKSQGTGISQHHRYHGVVRSGVPFFPSDF